MAPHLESLLLLLLPLSMPAPPFDGLRPQTMG
jgi:hypothetical protein